MHTITIYFVVCESGAFGYNCASNCHCTNQPCDREHGTCPAGGCQRGYEVITCSTGTFNTYLVNTN
jgi:hypothetical protein